MRFVALIRRLFRTVVVASVLMLIPAIAVTPAQKLEYRTAFVVEITQIPGKDMAERFVTVNLEGKTQKIRTRDRLIALRPGGTACVSQRTMLREHWVIYRLRLPEMCSTLRQAWLSPAS